MLSKSKQKFIRSLKLKKFRQKYHKIVVEGLKTSYEILKEGLIPVAEIYALESWFEKHQDFVPLGTVAEIVTEGDLKSLSSLSTPQTVLMICSPRAIQVDIERARTNLCLFLESIRDPGNFGTLCRIADWFGMPNVYYSPDCVDIYNPKVIQASMASVFRIRPMMCDLEVFHDFPREKIYGCDLQGTSLYGLVKPETGLILLGNESHGLSDKAKHLAANLVSIPDIHSLGAESLNVAVAGGIICAHFRSEKTGLTNHFVPSV